MSQLHTLGIAATILVLLIFIMPSRSSSVSWFVAKLVTEFRRQARRRTGLDEAQRSGSVSPFLPRRLDMPRRQSRFELSVQSYFLFGCLFIADA